MRSQPFSLRERKDTRSIQREEDHGHVGRYGADRFAGVERLFLCRRHGTSRKMSWPSFSVVIHREGGDFDLNRASVQLQELFLREPLRCCPSRIRCS